MPRKNRIYWVHYWPEVMTVYTERVGDGGKGRWRDLKPHQVDRLVNVIEGLLKRGVGQVMLPRYGIADWVWMRDLADCVAEQPEPELAPEGQLEAGFDLSAEMPRGRRTKEREIGRCTKD